MQNIVNITPVSVWTSTGTKSAVKFGVRYTNYNNDGTSTSDTVLLDAAGSEVAAQLVNASAAQTAAWTDDEAFYKVLAENAGLSPL
jgi:hypothetical protein